MQIRRPLKVLARLERSARPLRNKGVYQVWWNRGLERENGCVTEKNQRIYVCGLGYVDSRQSCRSLEHRQGLREILRHPELAEQVRHPKPVQTAFVPSPSTAIETIDRMLQILERFVVSAESKP